MIGVPFRAKSYRDPAAAVRGLRSIWRSSWASIDRDPKRSPRSRDSRRHGACSATAQAEAHGIQILTINALYPFDVWNAGTGPRGRQTRRLRRRLRRRALVLCPLNSVEDARSPAERAADFAWPVRGCGQSWSGTESWAWSSHWASRKAPCGPSGRPSTRSTMSAPATGSSCCTTPSTTTWPASRNCSPSERASSTSPASRTAASPSRRSATSTACSWARRTSWTMPARSGRCGTGGYAGPFSLEPFSPSVHALTDPAGAIRDSFAFVARTAANA